MKKWAKKNLWLITIFVILTIWYLVFPDGKDVESTQLSWFKTPIKDLSVGDAIFLMIIYSAFRK